MNAQPGAKIEYAVATTTALWCPVRQATARLAESEHARALVPLSLLDMGREVDAELLEMLDEYIRAKHGIESDSLRSAAAFFRALLAAVEQSA